MSAKRPLPDDFATVATGRSKEWACQHYKAGNDTVSRWFEESGLGTKNTGRKKRPAPDDFTAMFPTLRNQFEVCQHYQATEKIVRRWMREAGLKPHQVQDRPVPDDFAHVAPSMSKTQLGDRYKVSHDVINRWLRMSGIKPLDRTRVAHRSSRLVPTRGTGRPNLTITRAASIYDIAANELRRFGPVFRCDDRGIYRQAGDYWRMGWSILTPDELLERAARKRAA